MKILKNKRLWQCLLVVGLLPFLICLWQGIDGAVYGFSFMWAPAEDGWDGFLSAVLFWSVVYWPTYIVGLVLIVLSVWKLWRIRYT